MPRPQILQDREHTHGDFSENAKVAQELKGVMRAAGYLALDPVHIEALDMIVFKMSRIITGKAKVADHWKDIAGYAKLGEEICPK